MTTCPARERLPQRLRRLLLSLLIPALLAACGGGGGGDRSGGVGSGGTGAFSSGTISGFGSVIVNGVRFDDRNARIEDDDGTLRSRDDLRLGQVAEVESGPITAGSSTVLPSATASRVRYGSALLGRVGSVDVALSRLVVLGQPVRTTASTVFDAALVGGLSALRLDDVAEVYGFFDAASAGFVATRIERRDALPPRFKVRGLVSGVDAAARTFRIGDQVFSVDATLSLPSNAQLLRVEVETEPVAGRWVVAGARNAAPQLGDDQEAEIEGLITRFGSVRSFEVDGIPVSTDAATEFSGGAAGLALGVRVEVEGRIENGILRAEEVDLEDEDDDDGGSGGDRDDEFELSGPITAVDAANRRFSLRGVTVEHDGATQFDDGGVSDLSIGREVEVKGVLSADGTRLRAEEIEFD